MGGYTFDLTCPLCGSPVLHVASGTTNGVETGAVARCTGRGCGTRWLVRVRLLYTTDPDQPCDCSTDADYHRHRTRGEEPCVASRQAHADAEGIRNRARRERRKAAAQCRLS